MIKYIASVCWVLILTLGIAFQSQAQSFEGTVEISQQTAEGITYQMKWYIKENKVAYEITSFGAESMVPMRFVPLPEHNKMLMIAGGSRSEIAARDLTTPSFDPNKTSVKEEGGKIIITTDNTVTEVEVDKSVDIDFARYAQFFKADQSIYALAKMQLRGFPVRSTTRDQAGKILSQTTLKRIQSCKVDDSIFR